MTGLFEKRLAEIKIKYKEPPPPRPEQRREFRRNDQQRPRYGRPGVGEEAGTAGRTSAFTRNLVPGNRVYDEDLLRIDGSRIQELGPLRSKLAGAILKGELSPDVIRAGDKVLYLGASTGTTASHVSDIVGGEGLVVGVEMSARVGQGVPREGGKGEDERHPLHIGREGDQEVRRVREDGCRLLRHRPEGPDGDSD